jgi:hypothetical protein
MNAVLLLIGVVLRAASLAATIWLVYQGRWSIILLALGLSIASLLATVLADIPMRILWQELGYPEMLTTPGLWLIAGFLRLQIVSCLPPLIPFLLVWGLALGIFAALGSAPDRLERLASLLLGYGSAFQSPTVFAQFLTAKGEARGTVLSAAVIYGRLAFIVLLGASATAVIPVSYAAALLFAVMLATLWVFVRRARMVFLSLPSRLPA